MSATMTRAEATEAWEQGNNAGNGYAPEVTESDSIDDVVDAYVADGGKLVYARRTSDEIAVVEYDGSTIGIGGNAMGRGAWAVEIGGAVVSARIDCGLSARRRSSSARPVTLEAERLAWPPIGWGSSDPATAVDRWRARPASERLGDPRPRAVARP